MNRAEEQVMEIFRFYEVLPYQMLCLNGKVQQDLQAPLERMVERGFIVRENHHGAYHLTRTGYQAVAKRPLGSFVNEGSREAV